MQGGRVVGYADNLTLEDCQFIVQPAGNARVRRTGVKTVHAFIQGTLVQCVDWIPGARVAMYDPYKFETFVDGMTWKPIHQADLVVINSTGVLYKGKEINVHSSNSQCSC